MNKEEIMIKNNLIYALKDGKLTHISEVESGLNCACICPSCGESLVAKKGNRMIHHFAHKANSECIYGYQTSLHLLAKDILLEEKRILLPKVQINFYAHDGSHKEVEISNEKFLELDNVVLEKKQGEIIPDVIAYCGNKKLYIEIYVTHKIDDNKRNRIIKDDVSTIEIDLSEVDRYISKDMLKKILLEETAQKQWIYNSVENKWYKKFINDADSFEMKGSRINNCPIRTRVDKHGNPYAVFIKDCIYCEYCVDVIRDQEGFNLGIKCTGAKRISEISDYSKTINERIAISNQKLYEMRIEDLSKGLCPFCLTELVKRVGKYGVFYACSNYSYCNFTYSIDEETGELKCKYQLL